MFKDFDVEPYRELLAEAREAFLTDSAYAIAIARPAGALAARRQSKVSVGDFETTTV